MANTNIASGFVPELLTDAIAGGFTSGMNCFMNTGAVLLRNGMPSTTLGQKINVPYFASLGELDDVTTDGTDLTPTELTSSAEQATIAQAGKAFSISDWATLATAGDPYAEAASQIVAGVARKFDAALVTAATATNSGMTVDVYSATTPVYMTYDLIADGLAKFGDEIANIASIHVHSAVLAQLRKAKDGQSRPLFTSAIDGGLDRIMGIPIVVSDKLLVSSGKYKTLICKKNSLILWHSGSPVVETQRMILGARTLAAVHTYFAAHRYSRMPGLAKGGIVQLVHN